LLLARFERISTETLYALFAGTAERVQRTGAFFEIARAASENNSCHVILDFDGVVAVADPDMPFDHWGHEEIASWLKIAGVERVSALAVDNDPAGPRLCQALEGCGVEVALGEPLPIRREHQHLFR